MRSITLIWYFAKIVKEPFFVMDNAIYLKFKFKFKLNFKPFCFSKKSFQLSNNQHSKLDFGQNGNWGTGKLG